MDLTDELSRMTEENRLLRQQRDLAQVTCLDWHRAAGKVGDRVRRLIQERNALQQEITYLREELSDLRETLEGLRHGT